MKKIVSLLICVLSINVGFAQQDPMLSHYMFNGLFLNPAYAGSYPYIGATVVHRQQWLGFTGNPKTSVFGIDGPIKSKTMGVGLTFANDQIGGFKRNDLLFNYSYKINFSDKAKLSFGASAGFTNLGYNNKNTRVWNNNPSELESPDKGNDPAFQNSNFISPKFGFGIYFHSPKFYAGISAPTLYGHEPAKYSLAKGYDFNYFKSHFTFTSGYLFDVGSNVMLKPSVLIKYQAAAPMQYDINCNAYYGDGISGGISYRTDRTGSWFVGLLAYNLTPELRLGAAYDINFSGIRKYNKGSVEFMLGYDFVTKTVKVKNPRYF